MNIGLALGSGSSRGWSHIGVLSALYEIGVKPDIICGTSIGALVGASYISNNLDKLENWIRSLKKLEMAKFFNIHWSLNGIVDTKMFHNFLHEYVARDDALIEQCATQYAAVATDLETGREIWLQKGPILEAVRASIALPGLFPAIRYKNTWLVDGGLVNPVPVSVCRALGADMVIAVNLNGDIVGKHFQKREDRVRKDTEGVGKFTGIMKEYTSSLFASAKADDQPPSLFEAIAGSVNVIQDRITRSRMAGDPPDILLSPRLAHIGLLEFYRADEAISEGRACVQRMIPEIQHRLDLA